MAGESVFIPARARIVPKETAFASGTFSIEQGGKEADAVNFVFRGNSGFGEFGKGRVEVRGIDEV